MEDERSVSEELGRSDEKDEYCCSRRMLYEGMVGSVGRVDGKHDNILLLLLACSRHSLWTGRRGELVSILKALGSESLIGSEA